MEEVRNRLNGMLSWSDRIGSDEVYEIRSLIKMIENNEALYTKKEMEKSFVAGGKMAMNFQSDSFEEFLTTLKK